MKNFKSKVTEADKLVFKAEGVKIESLAEKIDRFSRYEYWFATYKHVRIVMRVTRSTKYIKFLDLAAYFAEHALEEIAGVN
jgi:hypothetical protein